MKKPWILASALLVGGLAGGCANEPVMRQTGFISDYSRLVEVNARTFRYVSPKASSYSKFIIDPIQSRLPTGVLSPQDEVEALQYMREAVERAVVDAGFTITNKAGLGVARLRLALTDVAESSWWKKIHPASRMAGAGTGGAAMEAELIDSVTGEQLGAVVQTATGSQYDLTAYSTLDDVKSAIDKWAALAVDRLREMRMGRTGP